MEIKDLNKEEMNMVNDIFESFEKICINDETKDLVSEIKKLVNENYTLHKNLDFMIDKNDEKQAKIDKAIEYINYDLKSFLYGIEYKTLLNILQGSDKE